jgi:hypothetical protein
MTCFVCALAFVAIGVTAWVIPLRMYFGSHGSFYTFAYMYDELYYAERMQPLLAGASNSNTVNGIGDPHYFSQFFLEDNVRRVITLLHLDVISAFWLWRALFPLTVMASIYLLSGECVPQCTRVSGRLLRISAAALGAALFNLEPLLVYSPPEGWLNRIPTNLEYPLSILVAWSYLRALRHPTPKRAMLLSLSFAAIFYFRIYVAVPWTFAISIGMIVLLIRRRIAVRTTGMMVGVLGLALLPWFAVAIWDAQLPVYAEMMRRYFSYHAGFVKIHPFWEFFVHMSGGVVIAGVLLRGSSRMFCITTGAALCVTPFVYHLFPFRSEVLNFNRLSSFYLTLCLTALLLFIGAVSRRRGANKYHLFMRALWVPVLICSLAASGLMAIRNSNFGFDEEDWSNYTPLVKEAPLIPAMTWVRLNTPSDSLFIVDDGGDMSRVGSSDELGVFINSRIGRINLFSVVAGRRRVFDGWLFINNISNRDIIDLAHLHWSTLGYPMDRELHMELLRRFRPNYIFWLKTNPQWRAAASGIGSICTTVYSDAVSEVWKIDRMQRQP